MVQQETNFWITVCLAVAIRIAVSSDRRDPTGVRLLKAILSFGVGIFSAVVFTDALVSYRNLDPDIFSIPAAALIALTAESVVRLVVNVMPRDTKALKEVLDAFKGWRS